MKRIRSLLLASAVLLLAGCSDVVESSHPTITAAKEDIQRGWIPEILPDSTSQIRESHNLDLNIGHGTFLFGVTNAQQFRAALVALPVDAVIPGFKVPRAQREREGFAFYRHNGFYLAVDWSRGRGEFWRGLSR